MSDYDPDVPMLRQLLGLQILGTLEDAGFAEEAPTRPLAKPYMAERIYARVDGLPPGMKVQVYTTVIGDNENVPIEVRRSGKDAIRVAAVYVSKDGKTRGLSKEVRVNRTGNIEDIANRMLERMRLAWKSCQTAQKCNSCGAPKFVTKQNKLACAELCWLTEEEKNKPYNPPRKKRYRRKWR
jgi:hypothetical protein